MCKEKESFETVTHFGAVASSALVGSAIGTAIAGPGGVVIGALAGTLAEKTIERIGKEISLRMLSKSEERKVGTVFSEAVRILDKRIKEGASLRNDEFFHETDGRCTAEEILEGTLFAAQREHEERKLKYYARLYAGIALCPDISRSMANQIIKLAEQLTYRQIIILHIIGIFQTVSANIPNPMRKGAYSSVSGTENVAISGEIFELYRMSILYSKSVAFDSAGIDPSALSVGGYGAHIYNLMQLSSLIPEEDSTKIIAEIMAFLTGTTLIQE